MFFDLAFDRVFKQTLQGPNSESSGRVKHRTSGTPADEPVPKNNRSSVDFIIADGKPRRTCITRIAV